MCLMSYRSSFITVVLALQVGCGGKITDTTFDAGEDAVGTKDTSVTPGETGVTEVNPVEVAPPPDVRPPPGSCADCQKAQCMSETNACAKDAACGKRIDCMNACIPKGGDVLACMNKCITDNPSTAGDDLISCLQDKCRKECFTF